MKIPVFSALSAVLLSTKILWADPITPVDLAPISHTDATLVVVGADGSETAYSPSQLEEFPTYSLTTATPWRDAPARFEGVLLADVLAAHGIREADAISVRAENDYSTVIPRVIWDSLDVLVATRVNGKPHTRRARGPIQFIIDMDAYTASGDTTESNLVWMAARISAEQ
ncbi:MULTISPECIES: molybdopterin-dependent oxidoreductase [unclassified Roseovarius]|uniref:molybdopterin-dependent oxidoreductase n=1 Tax=unclassified Roseovarius TaxID=2614913 RepID=UPI00273EFBFA|nr:MULTISPECIES: molybdopterin-dependent oxidoreductase [unclassified Roseovarius]